MHEMGIAKSILEIVEGEISTMSLKHPVETIVFRVNRINAVFPESLKFFFDSMKGNFQNLENSQLEFIVDPFLGICSKCGKKIESEEMIFTCNFCGGEVELQPVEEMRVESIIVNSSSED